MSTRPFRLAMLLAVAGLVVTTATAQPAQAPKTVTKVYSVADLVVPIPGTADAKSPSKTGKPCDTCENQLVQLITTTASPASWRENGGCGSIDYYALSMSLVVKQTPDVQEQIEDLLASLRHLLNLEVALEVRFVSVPEGFLKANKVKLTGEPGSGCVFLNDGQVRHVMEAVQADVRGNVMHAPKLTMVNGQLAKLALPGSVSTSEGEGTLRILTQPVVSADRRFVRLFLSLTECPNTVKVPTHGSLTLGIGVNSDQGLVGSVVLNERNFDGTRPIAFEKTVTLPDGGTMLFGGWKKDAVVPVEENECPVLGGIPCVNRLFSNVNMKSEARELYVLVTPRIIAEEVEERRGTEEQEEPEKVDPAQQRQAKVLAGVLKAYDEACAAGHAAEAKKYARAALAIDPTCFRR